MQKSSISPLDFVIQLLALGVGFMVLASLLSAGFNLHPGLTLIILGIFAMGAGNILSLPARRYERRRGIRPRSARTNCCWQDLSISSSALLSFFKHDLDGVIPDKLLNEGMPIRGGTIN